MRLWQQRNYEEKEEEEEVEKKNERKCVITLFHLILYGMIIPMRSAIIKPHKGITRYPFNCQWYQIHVLQKK